MRISPALVEALDVGRATSELRPQKTETVPMNRELRLLDCLRSLNLSDWNRERRYSLFGKKEIRTTQTRFRHRSLVSFLSDLHSLLNYQTIKKKECRAIQSLRIRSLPIDNGAPTPNEKWLITHSFTSDHRADRLDSPLPDWTVVLEWDQASLPFALKK